MRNKLAILVLILSVLLAGCINKEEKLRPSSNNTGNGTITVKYLENRNQTISKNDFPDFKLVDQKYLITPINLSMTLETESVHGALVINSSDNISKDFRVYGISESYNASDRHILVQYKVFDNGENLNDSIDLTVNQYVQDGFKTEVINNTAHRGRIFVLKSNNNTNITIPKNMEVTVILFGYDTVIGKIGVQDYKDKSLNESLKALDIVLNILKVNTKVVKTDSKFGSEHGTF